MPPPRDPASDYREWMRYADTDLRAGRALYEAESVSPIIVAFHAQQAAEKALKAYLVARDVKFPFTHSIAALRELIEDFGGWANDLADADVLTEYATTARYPGIGKRLTRPESRRLLDLAQTVLSAVGAALAADGFKLEQPD